MAICFCHCLSQIDNEWPVWLLQHHKEKKHAIGTAKIAELSLSNCLTFDDRFAKKQNVFVNALEVSQPLLVYPGKNAINVAVLSNLETRPLLFLDGSWRKTRKLFYTYPQLENLTRIAFTPEKESRYRIRKEPDEKSVSTLEAIVSVLSTLENNEEKYQTMLGTMDWMINKQIEYMGEETYKKNYQNKVKN